MFKINSAQKTLLCACWLHSKYSDIWFFFLQCKAQYYTGKVCMKDSLYGESTVRFEVSFVTQLLLCVLID